MRIWVLDFLGEARGSPTEKIVGFGGGEADLLSRVGPVGEVCCDYGWRHHFFVGFERVVYGDERVEG